MASPRVSLANARASFCRNVTLFGSSFANALTDGRGANLKIVVKS
jgi:hypothetical protein